MMSLSLTQISLILSEVEGRGGFHRTNQAARPRPSTSLRMRAPAVSLSSHETPNIQE